MDVTLAAPLLRVSEPLLLGIAIPVVTVLLIVGAVLQQVGQRRRTEALAAWAQENGWTFEARDTKGRAEALAGYKPFGTGSRRIVSHIFAGEREGLAIEAFDYRYTVQSGKHSQTYHFVIGVAQMPLRAPGLTIEPESLGHKLFDAFGGEDIDVEDDAFSKRYWVRSGDRRFAYDVLHAPMQDFLMAQHDQTWQWGGDKLVIFAPGRLQPSDLAPMSALLSGFTKALPRHLLHEVKARRAR